MPATIKSGSYSEENELPFFIWLKFTEPIPLKRNTALTA